MAPIQSGSQRRPRSSVSRAAAKATISSARPQLSVSGYEEWLTSGGRNAGSRRHGRRDRKPEAEKQ